MTEQGKERQVIDAGRQQPNLSTADMAAAGRQAAAPVSDTKQILEDAVPIEPTSAAPSMPTTPRQATPQQSIPQQATPQQAIPQQATPQPPPLLVSDETHTFRSRWDTIQTGFVDEPRRSVEQADSLVAEVMQRLAETFADERSKLEGQWSRGDNVSTEDLRLALQRYRSFFDRLLSM
jgi:hypothetical protein